MRKWFVVTVVVSIVAILLLPAGYVGYLGWKYTHPPKKSLEGSPELLRLAYQDVAFPSHKDQVTLRGWLVQSEKQNRRIVIFAHGYSENRESAQVALDMAESLYQEGIASLLFDFRASGESDGEMSSFGFHEQNDLIGAIEYVKRLGYERIGLMGFSMGAATALEVAPDMPEVEVVVADSAYTDMTSFFQGNLYYLHEKYGLLRSEELQAKLAKYAWFRSVQAFLEDHQEQIKPMLAAVVPKFVQWEVSLLTGIQPHHVQPIQAVSALNKEQSVFLIHAQGDSIIPASESERLSEACVSENKLLWVSKSDYHVGTYDSEPREYVRRTTEFLSYHLQNKEMADEPSEEEEVVPVWRNVEGE